MKVVLFSNWNFMRWLRLGIGIYFMYEAISSGEIVLGFLAAFFIIQALTNTGCGVNGCAPYANIQKKSACENPNKKL